MPDRPCGPWTGSQPRPAPCAPLLRGKVSSTWSPPPQVPRTPALMDSPKSSARPDLMSRDQVPAWTASHAPRGPGASPDAL